MVGNKGLHRCSCLSIAFSSNDNIRQCSGKEGALLLPKLALCSDGERSAIQKLLCVKSVICQFASKQSSLIIIAITTFY